MLHDDCVKGYFEDGRLVIFKRSGIFYARLRTLGSAKYIWRSLKTSDEQAAIQLGRRLLFQLEQRADHGFPLKSKLFSAVIDDYIRYRERDHRTAELPRECCGRSFVFRSSGVNTLESWPSKRSMTR